MPSARNRTEERGKTEKRVGQSHRREMHTAPSPEDQRPGDMMRSAAVMMRSAAVMVAAPLPLYANGASLPPQSARDIASPARQNERRPPPTGPRRRGGGGEGAIWPTGAPGTR